MKILAYFLSLFLFISCSKNGKTKENNQTVNETTELSCLVIKFTSPGNGIDLERNQKLLDFTKNNNIQYQVKNWGREGERTYSIDLSKLKTDQKKNLLALADEFKTNSKKINVEQLKNCTENQ